MDNAPLKLASPTLLPLSLAPAGDMLKCTIAAPPTTADPHRFAQLAARITNEATLPTDDNLFNFKSDNPETLTWPPGVLSLYITDPNSIWVPKSYLEAMCQPDL